MKFRPLWMACAALAAMLALPGQTMEPARLQVVSDAAQAASRECLHLMHHDTDEFSQCIDARMARSTGQPPATLGESYMGLVGCLAAARIATKSSHDCARRYLTQVDRLRRSLRVSDEQLCPAVPGDCRTRVAQINAMRRAARP